MTKKSERHSSSNIIVIGVDHGWSLIKTSDFIFTTGVKELTTRPAFPNHVLEFENKYYAIGEKRLIVKDTKVENENFYLLTLVAIAMELRKRGVRCGDICLSVGLPLSKYGAEKKDFIDYLSKNSDVSFKYEDVSYRIRIVKIMAFPQCYAAVADKLSSRKREQLVVDIGSWTFDCLTIKDMIPQNGESTSKEIGLITCMNEINDECIRQLKGEIAESDIQHIMMTGKSELPEKYTKIVVDRLKAFTKEVCDTLKEEKYNIDLTPVITSNITEDTDVSHSNTHIKENVALNPTLVYVKENDTWVLNEGNKVIMYDDTTKIEFSKLSITDGQELLGCKMKVTDKDTGTIMDESITV